MKVLKFGGTSLGNSERIKNAVEIALQESKAFVVLSAMSGTTNRLIDISDHVLKNNKQKALKSAYKLQNQYHSVAKELLKEPEKAIEQINKYFAILENQIQASPKPYTEKHIVSFGELLSTNLFYQYLKQNNIKSTLLNATELIRLNSKNEPEVEDIKSKLENKIQLYNESRIFITQGFICSDIEGNISNLGRGGSDYSASLFGAALSADEIQIWTDIDGVQNNDPRIIDSTQPIRKLLFDEAAELAYFGAKILHPSCVLPAKENNIPVLLKNTLHPDDPGTSISKKTEGTGFKAVAARDNITAIRIKSSRMLLAYGFLRKVFEVFEKYETPIDMITTSEVAVSLTIDNEIHLSEIIAELQTYGTVSVNNNKTIVGIVGNIMAEEPGHAEKLFSALADIPIRMISYGASAYNMSILINTEDKKRTLQALNDNLFYRRK